MLIDRLKSQSRVYGTAIVSTSPLWPAMVKQCNIDFVFLDAEHMPLGRTELAQLCRVYRSLDLNPLVRIFNQDPYELCKVLDAGAVGVIVPYLEDPESVRKLIGAVKLRPLKGKYLDEYVSSTRPMNPELAAYIAARNAETIFIANIESMPALENLDEILSLPGLDGIFIGPHDLSCSMGIPEQYDHPEFVKIVTAMIQKSRRQGIAIGVHFSEQPERQIYWAGIGANIIVHSSDMAMFKQRFQTDLQIIRNALADQSESMNVAGMVI